MAFKCGRDSTIFTSHGILDVDVQGFSGKRREFRNIPYECIRHFSVESSGSFDRDSELDMILPTPWLPKVSRDFRAGNVDIIAVQNMIASKILGAPGKPGDFIDANTVTASPDPGAMSQLLHTSRTRISRLIHSKWKRNSNMKSPSSKRMRSWSWHSSVVGTCSSSPPKELSLSIFRQVPPSME